MEGLEPLGEGGEIRLCVVMPVANEAATIESLLADVLRHLGDRDRLLLIIDKVSTDGTRELVRGCISRPGHARVTLIEAPENRCVTDAYMRGYREAMQLNPRWILEMDAGYSHDPADIPRFIQAMEQGYDYVGGSRFADGSRYSAGAYRRLLSQGGSWVARRLLHCPLTDMTSGYQCYGRKAMALVLDKGVFSRGGFFQTEIRYLMSRLKWKEIPISYGNTKPTVPFRHVLEGLTGLFRLAGEARREPGA